ncbi:hypothetical protein CsSME_00013084 [Camellia sinensis var. sinensis]
MPEGDLLNLHKLHSSVHLIHSWSHMGLPSTDHSVDAVLREQLVPSPPINGRLFCRGAGIKVTVITGDNKLTAEAICKVFSRAEPRHKQEIVRMLKETGEIVAMTGDGVNDAPALKLADIGIAMRITGTEAAKEGSDMVLADDSFNPIVSAVAEGCSIYNNTKAFIRYMISSNVGELLLVNLVTDGPPATAPGFNPADIDIMRKPPCKSDDALINSWILFRYMAPVLVINLVSDGHSRVEFSQLWNWGECSSWWSNFIVTPFTVGGGRVITFSNPCDYFTIGKVKAMTLSLSVLAAIEMFNSLNALSEDNSLVTIPPCMNPWLLVAMSVTFGLHCLILHVPFLADVFGIVPLTLNEWFLVFLLKFVGRRRRRRRKRWRTKVKKA